jgi:hypothetical protein
MEKLKFYNNNPCKVIREINADFSEVEVYPQFDTDMNGSEWCTECMMGNQGTPSTHTCDEYQEVIDAIRCNEAAMIVIVENRLLANEPIEFKAWEKVKSQVKEMGIAERESLERKTALNKDSKRIADYVVELKEEMYDAERLLEDTRRAVELNKDKIRFIKKSISEEESKVSIGGVSISMNASELKSLIKAKIQLDALEAGGVDNWEWYGESCIDSDKLEVLAQEEILSIKVIGLS